MGNITFLLHIVCFPPSVSASSALYIFGRDPQVAVWANFSGLFKYVWWLDSVSRNLAHCSRENRCEQRLCTRLFRIPAQQGFFYTCLFSLLWFWRLSTFNRNGRRFRPEKAVIGFLTPAAATGVTAFIQHRWSAADQMQCYLTNLPASPASNKHFNPEYYRKRSIFPTHDLLVSNWGWNWFLHTFWDQFQANWVVQNFAWCHYSAINSSGWCCFRLVILLAFWNIFYFLYPWTFFPFTCRLQTSWDRDLNFSLFCCLHTLSGKIS